MTEPLSVTTRPISEADRAAIEEQDAIRRGVADLTFAWASVENAMVMLLAELLRYPSGYVGSGHLASAIYFTPASIEVRTKLVESAVKCRVRLACANLTSGAQIEAHMLEEWGLVMTRLTRLRKTRNKVAHGEMTVFGGTANAPGYARLTAPMLKMDDDREEALLKGQKPGLGSNELKTSTTAVILAVEQIRNFWPLVQLLDDGDSASLLQRFAEAKTESPSQPHQDNQTPPEPESRQLPSRE
jgi:hypothetical protein